MKNLLHLIKILLLSFFALGTVCSCKTTMPEIPNDLTAAQLIQRGQDALANGKYKIADTRQLRMWIMKYNGHEELKDSGIGGSPIMTKGRKTTFEERVEIVQYCINNAHNYAETAEKFGISYQQARSYTLKYEEKGVKGLQDRRGKRKSQEEMDELEKLRAEVKLLRTEKERAKMEISFLKKLEEIERRRS